MPITNPVLGQYLLTIYYKFQAQWEVLQQQLLFVLPQNAWRETPIEQAEKPEAPHTPVFLQGAQSQPSPSEKLQQEGV